MLRRRHVKNFTEWIVVIFTHRYSFSIMKRCFVCGACEDVIDFTTDTLQRCLNIIAFRRGKNFKYGDLELSRETASEFSYHVACYRKLNILKQKYKAEFDAAYPTEKVSIRK